MTVYEIDKNKIKISLTDTEVLCCFGTYEKLLKADKKIKPAIEALVRDIVAQYSEFFGGKKLIAKISVHKTKGCDITIYTPKHYRVLAKKEYTLVFSNFENLVRAASLLYRKDALRYSASSLYKLKNDFHLLIKASNQNAIFPVNEFWSSFSASHIRAEFTKEYATPILLDNAILQLGKYF